jgi:hypothetical protein
MAFDSDFQKLADRFLEFVRTATGCSAIVCDESATIVRAVVRSRVGTVHAGAQRILRGEVDEAEVTAEEAAANPLVKEGFSCPIVVDGRRVGTFGITGDLRLTRPLGRVAAMMLATWVEELRQQRELAGAAARVFSAVDELVERAERARAASASLAGARARAEAEAAARIAHAGEVARSVQRIARQGRMLSINGSVEATRAGDAGRSFGVVALEMTRLANEIRVASGDIESALAAVGGGVSRLSGALARSAAAAEADARALADATAVASDLKASIERLRRLSDLAGSLSGSPGESAPARSGGRGGWR